MACGDLFFFEWNGKKSVELILASGIFFFILVVGFFFRRYATRWLFGVFLVVELFLAGMAISDYHLMQVNTAFPIGETIYKAVVVARPQSKKRTAMIQVRLLEQSKDGRMIPFQAEAILYFPKDTSSLALHKGDVLLISSHIAPPAGDGNPDSFNYARYLHRRGIGGTGFVKDGRWMRMGHIEDTSFPEYALKCRERILSIYRSFGWDKNVFSVVSALSVGYVDELSTDIRETYSITGASHVLSLSGLHIGFLYVLFLLFLKPLGRSRWMCMLRGFIIITLLWAFAFFTGMSPSVVRSVIMFSLFAVAEALRRDTFSLNTLAAAAFFMLLFSPSWLFDVGFQLSFCAVASLLLFEPYIYSLIKVHTKIGKWAWQLTSVSIAAQIGTIPLVLYYFSRFSVYFMLSGFVVIPLASFIMYGAVLLLVCTPIPFLQGLVAFVLQWLVWLLNGSLHWIEQLPYASIDGIWVYLFEVIFFYSILLLFLQYLSSRKVRDLYLSLAGVFLLVGMHSFFLYNDKSRDSIVFYNVRSCPVVHCISSDANSWLVCASPQSDVTTMCKTLSHYWSHLHLDKPKVLATNDYCNDRLSVESGILTYGGKRIGIVSDNRWRYQRTTHLLPVNYLYLCHGYTGKLEELLSLFRVRMVIIDSSLSDWRQQTYSNACRNLHIPFVSLRKGAYLVDL